MPNLYLFDFYSLVSNFIIHIFKLIFFLIITTALLGKDNEGISLCFQNNSISESKNKSFLLQDLSIKSIDYSHSYIFQNNLLLELYFK